MRRTLCCARAANGYVAEALSKPINSRRLIVTPELGRHRIGSICSLEEAECRLLSLSSHVQCKSPCLLWARSRHRLTQLISQCKRGGMASSLAR
jgi:hypothetical protein